ncbi:DUF835 domain-containing protein [Thermococcus indicus]|uniref:DUF835 domain-containing protein n=1 Tax=Thermococcus indicus TaxID=2586643 RepID=A0A4Y5SKI1_9EURY|nr:DUF835 domain-containing protein [Thermococcus indicus]QDA30649.1 DUF835 domain-containing protein [Thermococcus indicus]
MNLLLVGQFLSFFLKITAGLVLLLNWRRYRRQSILLWALFFLSSSMALVSEILGFRTGIPLFHALGISLLTGGVVSFLDEEAVVVPTRPLKILSMVLPFAVSAYTVIYASLIPSPNPIYLAYGVSGIFYTLAGAILWAVRRSYSRTGTLLGGVVIAHGIHKMDYPFLRPVEWFAPIGFTVGAVLNGIEAVMFVKIVFSERFRNVRGMDNSEIIRSGVFIVSPGGLNGYAGALSEFPVLAFARRSDLPPKWEIHPLTTIDGPGTIGPTQLHRIVERTRAYLMKAHRENITGVVVLEGLEYLIMYNDFRSVLKFLATLSDYISLYRGMLLIVLDEKSLDETERKILRQVLGTGDVR